MTVTSSRTALAAAGPPRAATIRSSSLATNLMVSAPKRRNAAAAVKAMTFRCTGRPRTSPRADPSVRASRAPTALAVARRKSGPVTIANDGPGWRSRSAAAVSLRKRLTCSALHRRAVSADPQGGEQAATTRDPSGGPRPSASARLRSQNPVETLGGVGPGLAGDELSTALDAARQERAGPTVRQDRAQEPAGGPPLHPQAACGAPGLEVLTLLRGPVSFAAVGPGDAQYCGRCAPGGAP